MENILMFFMLLLSFYFYTIQENNKLQQKIDTLTIQNYKLMDLVGKQKVHVEYLRREIDEMKIGFKQHAEDIRIVQTKIAILTKDDEMLKVALDREISHLFEQVRRLEHEMKRGPLDMLFNGFKSIMNLLNGYYKVKGLPPWLNALDD